ADGLSEQELVLADAVQLRSSGGAQPHPGGRQPRKQRLPASHAMGERRGHRCAAGRLELARRLEPEARARHPESCPFHTRRTVVRALAERRLRRALVRGARRDAAPTALVATVMADGATADAQGSADDIAAQQAEPGNYLRVCT